jgi:hypothetical protein
VSKSDGSYQRVPLTGISSPGVADYYQQGQHFTVVESAVPRGTAGVAVSSAAAGGSQWAHLVDAGPTFDELFFAVRVQSQPVAAEAVDSSGQVASTVTLLHALAPQPAADPGQEAANGVVTLTLQAPSEDGADAQLCLTEVATGAHSCDSTLDNAEDGTQLNVKLADGRVAAGGMAPPAQTLATLDTTHPLRLGLLPLDPLAYLWISDAPPHRRGRRPAWGASRPGRLR